MSEYPAPPRLWPRSGHIQCVLGVLFRDTSDEQGFEVHLFPGPAGGVQDPEHTHGRNCLEHFPAIVTSPLMRGFNHIPHGEIPKILHDAFRLLFRHDPSFVPS